MNDAADPITLMLVLAQQSGTRPWNMGDSMKVAGLIGGLILGVLIAGAILLAVRRRMLIKDSSSDAASLLMDELRRMRRGGEMTPEEYDAARAAATQRLASTKAPSPRPAVPKAEQPPGGELRARPGYDLTGAPLPRTGSDRAGPAG